MFDIHVTCYAPHVSTVIMHLNVFGTCINIGFVVIGYNPSWLPGYLEVVIDVCLCHTCKSTLIFVCIFRLYAGQCHNRLLLVDIHMPL